MAVDPVPWAIHGAKHSADVARQNTYDSTGGAEGVSSPKALQVRATQTPSGQVRVAPGGALMLSPFDAGQTYNFRNASETLVDVPASSSLAASTWYINAWINDPNKPGGTEPASVPFGPYAFLTCDAAPKGNFPHYTPAKIVVPKNEAVVRQADIEDLRELAQPRSKPVNRSRPLNIVDAETLTMTDPAGERFPNAGGGQDIPIPEWATRAIIETEWLMVNERPGNAYGAIWVEFGPLSPGGDTREYSTQRFRWNTQAGTDSSRGVWKVSDDVYIPADLRGTSQVFSMRGYLTYTSAGSARPQMDQHSGIAFKVTFLEEADRSTT